MAVCGVSPNRLVWMGLLFLFGLLELVFSQLADSLTLLLDSFHSLWVLLDLAMPVLAECLARRPVPSAHTFAWERLVAVGCLVADVLLLSLCCSVSVAAVSRLLSPHPFHRPTLPIAAGAGGIVVNLGLHLWLRSIGGGWSSSPSLGSGQDLRDSPGEHPRPKDKSADSTRWENDPAAARDTADRGAQGKRILSCLVGVGQSVLSSVLALAVGFLHSFPAAPAGSWHKDCLPYLDPGLSLLTALALVIGVAPRLKVSVLLLLECVPEQVDLRRLTERLAAVSGVVAVHELHVWRLSSRRVLASAHVQCRSLVGFARVSGDLRRVFDSEGIHSATVQPEFISPAGIGSKVCQLACGPQCAKKLCCEWPKGA
ncbi:proton-coupled zinc antiporter SLC30A1-like [Scyliorhinus torazame]|uniref:proton-coupled zinc antiporter SLC30A1-like n=1 Tax=Scyliorhinus torazame TaxID=75743 RepID=UPI003B5CDC30